MTWRTLHTCEVRRTRRTGTTVTVCHGDDAGLDTTPEGGGAWYTICEHGTTISHATLKLARWHAPEPDAWCDECHDAREARRPLIDHDGGAW